MTKNEAIQKAMRLERENAAMASALRVIHTWASFDDAAGDRLALIPVDVVRLCDKVLQ
jgi:hypothetical protein